MRRSAAIRRAFGGQSVEIGCGWRVKRKPSRAAR